WNATTNWSPNQVPGPSDSATLALGVTVTVGVPTTVSNLTFSAGTLYGSGPLTVQGTMNWGAGGSLSNVLAVASGATLNLTNASTFYYFYGVLTNNGTVVMGNSGGYVYLRGTGDGKVYNNGLWLAQGDNTRYFLNDDNSTNKLFLNAGIFRLTGNGSTS